MNCEQCALCIATSEHDIDIVSVQAHLLLTLFFVFHFAVESCAQGMHDADENGT